MDIPSHATRVFKGKMVEVYQWEQELFDGSLTTFEETKRPEGIQIIAEMKGKLLVSKEQQPSRPQFHSFLGGYKEEGEEPIEAAKRELLEEAGLASDDWDLFKITQPIMGYGWKMHTFIARNCTKVCDPKLEAGERIEIIHLNFDEFLSLVDSESFRGKEYVIEIIKMKYEKDRAEEFKKKVFSTISNDSLPHQKGDDFITV